MKFLQVLQQRAKLADSSDALRICNEHDPQEISWQELYERVRVTALLLQNLGVVPGNRVGLLAENSLDGILIDLACHYFHAVSVPMNTYLSSQQISKQIRHSGASLLFVSEEF